MPTPMYNRKVECATCHDAHNKGYGEKAMLRQPIGGSQLCYICHNK